MSDHESNRAADSGRPYPQNSKIRLYVEGDLVPGAHLLLEKAASHYLSKVMRQRPGDALLVFNGRDGAWQARIETVDRHQVSLAIEFQQRPQTDPPDVALLFALIKRARMDILIEKATELGATELQPMITQNSVVDRTNLNRQQARIIEASEQSGRLSLPLLKPAVPLQKLLDHWPAHRKLVYCTPEHGLAATALLPAITPPLAILIGPEGGFSADEIACLQAHPNSAALSLGTNILRAETAAIAALSLIQSLCNHR